MNILIKKETPYRFHYIITRGDRSTESVTLDTDTYFLHDICHFVVEKNLNYQKGFWGMLSEGHAFAELSGRNNPLTEELRFIEQIVGPIQATYSGHIPVQAFPQSIAHLGFNVPSNILEKCLVEIRDLMFKWRQLAVGEQLLLEWKL